MKRKFLFLSVGIMLLFWGYNLFFVKRYKLTSLVGGNEYIDVTSFVSSGEYIPYYCSLDSSDLLGLKKVNPENLSSENRDTLLSLCQKWLSENNKYCEQVQLLRSTYAYTYFIHDKTPYHVFRVTFLCDQTDMILYIRQTEKGLFGSFDKRGWATCGVE